MREIYLDHNATTPLHPRVGEAMREAWQSFGNPSSPHLFGRRAASLCEAAREQVAALLSAADPNEICFTGSGSEANNLALQGTLRALDRKGPARPRRVVSTRVEHPSVLQTLEALAETGVEVEFVRVDSSGALDLDALDEALRRPADLVSVMLANNEVGTVQPITEAARAAHAAGALLHVDAIQAVGKIPVDVRRLGADLLSASCHKMNGPKGVGFLYVRRGVPLGRLVHGGSQEHGRRAGTENTWGLVGAGAASAVFRESGLAEMLRLQALRDRLWEGLQKRVDGLERYGSAESCLPGTLGIGIDGLHAEPVLLRLDLEGIAVSMGSACHSGASEPSHVLTAMGVSPARARGYLRLSLGLGNTDEDVDAVLEALPRIVEELRSMQPSRRALARPEAPGNVLP